MAETKEFLDYNGLDVLIKSMSPVVKNGNVNELVQASGDVLILKGGDAAAFASSEA